jgi:pyridoxal phosphate-dependent aminotransferase EpsN
MNSPFPHRIHLSKPHMGGAELGYVQQAFAANWLSTVGPNLDALEAAFQRLVGLPAVALSSGTAGLHLGYKLLGLGPGDEVLTPTLTFAASCNPVCYVGARPVFLDSDRATWNLDPNLLADELRRRADRNRLPKAVSVVHLFGQPADLDPILEACRRYEVPLLEDAAESLGARYRGRHPGTLGEVGIFSFNGNKIITGTSGGMLVSPRADWVEKARFWSTQARDPDPLGIKNYVHSELGYNYRLSNVLAGIVRGQLEVLDLRVRQRRAIFERYRQAFADLPGIEPQPEWTVEGRRSKVESGDPKSEVRSPKSETQDPASGEEMRNAECGTRNDEAAGGTAGENPQSAIRNPQFQHTRWLSCFLIDEARFGLSAGDLIRQLEAANVESRPVWKPMHTQPLYRGYECIGGAVAEDLNRRGICLPSSSCLTGAEQEFVIERVRAAHFQADSRRRNKVAFVAPSAAGAAGAEK